MSRWITIIQTRESYQLYKYKIAEENILCVGGRCTDKETLLGLSFTLLDSIPWVGLRCLQSRLYENEATRLIYLAPWDFPKEQMFGASVSQTYTRKDAAHC